MLDVYAYHTCTHAYTHGSMLIGGLEVHVIYTYIYRHVHIIYMHENYEICYHTCTHVYIHTHIHTCMHTHTYTRTCTSHTHTCTCTHITHTCTCTHITHMHMYTCIHIHTCTSHRHMHMYAWILYLHHGRIHPFSTLLKA